MDELDAGNDGQRDRPGRQRRLAVILTVGTLLALAMVIPDRWAAGIVEKTTGLIAVDLGEIIDAHAMEDFVAQPGQPTIIDSLRRELAARGHSPAAISAHVGPGD